MGMTGDDEWNILGCCKATWELHGVAVLELKVPEVDKTLGSPSHIWTATETNNDTNIELLDF